MWRGTGLKVGGGIWRLMVPCPSPAGVRVPEDSWRPGCQCGVHQVRRGPSWRGAAGVGQTRMGGALVAGGQQEGPKGRPHSWWKFEDWWRGSLDLHLPRVGCRLSRSQGES